MVFDKTIAPIQRILDHKIISFFRQLPLLPWVFRNTPSHCTLAIDKAVGGATSSWVSGPALPFGPTSFAPSRTCAACSEIPQGCFQSGQLRTVACKGMMILPRLSGLNLLSLGCIEDIIPLNFNRLDQAEPHAITQNTNLGPHSIIGGRAQMALQPLVHCLGHRYFFKVQPCVQTANTNSSIKCLQFFCPSNVLFFQTTYLYLGKSLCSQWSGAFLSDMRRMQVGHPHVSSGL